MPRGGSVDGVASLLPNLQHRTSACVPGRNKGCIVTHIHLYPRSQSNALEECTEPANDRPSAFVALAPASAARCHPVVDALRAEARSDGSRVVEPLAMIPGTMWSQVGWHEEIRRNIFTATRDSSRGCQTVSLLRSDDCPYNLSRLDQIGRITQDGLVCRNCGAILARVEGCQARD